MRAIRCSQKWRSVAFCDGRGPAALMTRSAARASLVLSVLATECNEMSQAITESNV
jgi:hypothetical protein